ncbi:vomeronasal type-2 receptor 26-like [Pseudophryne corroboree]|uniref:vomeronasal type-2 receptor 26-like n=1 Tax=Pseudophryne corroboree TaxID=495146 RepID=UPI00308122A9
MQSVRRFKRRDDKINECFQQFDFVLNVLHQMIWLCILSITLCRSETQNPAPGCHFSPANEYGFEYKYSQEGDVIIGGIFTVNNHLQLLKGFFCMGAHRAEYRHVRAFIFAINQINRNPDILPNITLGYHLYDSCGSEFKAVEDVFRILSGHKKSVPNYRCMEHGKVAGFIGDLNSHTTITMAQLLNVYGYTQGQLRGEDSQAALEVIPDCEDIERRLNYNLLKCFLLSALVTDLNDYRPIAITSLIMKCFERIVLSHLKGGIPLGFDPNQLTYRLNRSTEDTVLMVLHRELCRLENRDTYVRLLFVDYSSVFNMISYGASDPVLSDQRIYPHFFRTIQDDQMQCLATVKLLKHFGWNWVGIISSIDNSGEQELQQLSKQLANQGICIEFKIIFFDDINYSLNEKIIKHSTTEIILICGKYSFPFVIFIRSLVKSAISKTFIFPTSWSYVPEIALPYQSGIPVICSLVFTLPTCNIPGSLEFLDNINPPNNSLDPLLEDIWITEFLCMSKNKLKNVLLPLITETPIRNCTWEIDLKGYVNFSRDPFPYRVHIAVFTIAQALHDMYLLLNHNGTRNEFKMNEYKLHTYIENLHYKNEIGEEIFYNEKGEMPSPLDLINWVCFNAGNHTGCNRKYVGTFDGSVTDDKQLHIEQRHIHWLNGMMPRGQCSEKCHDGFRKAPGDGYHACCYNCVPCSEGEISNKSDNENCIKCRNTEWPNNARNQCIAKAQEFLSYGTDTITSVFTVITALFTVIIVLIIGIFISFWNSQIVRANNQNLSFILLISLKLSLLCVFLFIGHPVDITCMLRQICFGIIFTIAVSSVLAKTIMVCIAFKATSPGSSWKKWMGVKLSNSLVVICSSVQVLNGVIWLSVSPPFQEFDMDTYPGTIIIQCNEGSVLAFYFMLGYMGFLAAVSFVLAFMVRTLPDIYNEAKYVTFSMLVFCSVWVCAIPAYLSSKGKNMVIVEVFAILASCIGLLGCIFFPKCYYILTRTEINKKDLFVRKTPSSS